MNFLEVDYISEVVRILRRAFLSEAVGMAESTVSLFEGSSRHEITNPSSNSSREDGHHAAQTCDQRSAAENREDRF